MTAPWWGIALAVGLVGGGALWALQANAPEPEPETHVGPDGTITQGPAPVPDVLVPFAGATMRENSTTTFLVLAPHGPAAFQAAVNRSSGPLGQTTWQSDHVALYSFTSGPYVCCAGRAYADGWPLPMVNVVPNATAGPGLFHEGYNATKVTAYIFDEAGELLASNANDTARFDLHDDFIRLPSVAWYLGDNDTAPAGTTFLPGLAAPLVEKVRPELDGLPVGGVASTRSNAYVNYYGSLFVTVRIDALVHAP